MKKPNIKKRTTKYKNGKDDSVILNTIAYNKYKNNLPNNLKHEDYTYDLYGAFKAGLNPELQSDGTYHLGSRDPKTGKILKSTAHPTFSKAVYEDMKMGYYPVYKNGNIYTKNPFQYKSGKDSIWDKYSKFNDSFASIPVKFLDPTGISSWKDVYDAWTDKDLNVANALLETAGAVPLIGKIAKIGKAAKILSKDKNLFKTQDYILRGIGTSHDVQQQIKKYKGGKDGIELKPVKNWKYVDDGSGNMNIVDTNTGQVGTLAIEDPVITTRDPRKYDSSFDGSFRNLYNTTDAMTGGLFTMLPVLGDAMDVGMVANDVADKNYAQAGIGAGMLLLPNLLEKPLRYIGRGIKNSIRNAIINRQLSKNINNLNIENKILSNTNESKNINLIQPSKLKFDNKTKYLDYNTNYVKPSQKIIENSKNLTNNQSYYKLNRVSNNVDYGNLEDDYINPLSAALNNNRIDQDYYAYLDDPYTRIYDDITHTSAIDLGLFGPDFDEYVDMLQTDLDRVRSINQRYNNALSNLDSVNDEQLRLLLDDRNEILYNRYVPSYFLENREIGDVYNALQDEKNNLPSYLDIRNLRNRLHNRNSMNLMQQNIQFYNRILEDPETNLHGGYDWIYNNVPNRNIFYSRVNGDTEFERLFQEMRTARDQVDNLILERQQRRLDEIMERSRSRAAEVTSETQELSKPLHSSLLSDDAYDPNNLPENFINENNNWYDVNSASYFNMNPREAVKKSEEDFNNLKHGQAWSLTHDGATSTDSYPLMLNMMKRHKDKGLIKPIKNTDGDIETMSLNHLGTVVGQNAIDRINKKILQLQDILGEELPKAQYDGYNIKVPKILFRKYNDGKDSGIHIKKANVGKFTKAAEQHGMSVQQFANKVLKAPKGKYSSTLRKRANFARNAKNFNH